MKVECALLTETISTAYYINYQGSSNKFDEIHCFNQLHLQEGGLHADINGDGVLDHVQVCNCFFHPRQFINENYEFILNCLVARDKEKEQRPKSLHGRSPFAYIMFNIPNVLFLKYLLHNMP
jgi:hypothetical protein